MTRHTALPASRPLSRRAFVSTSALSLIAAGAATQVRASETEEMHRVLLTEGGGFDYEIKRTEADWSARLTKDEFTILRLGGTEFPKTSPLWQETRDGMYFCKGCALPVYDSRWKVPLDKGWVFFTHSEVNAVLTGIDGPVPQYGSAAMSEDAAHLEVHCRRCGSHLGHLLPVSGQQVHCINGTALLFEEKAA